MFQQNQEAWTTLAKWHHGLAEHDKGGRAQLRRAASPGEVALVPAFHRLLHSLEEAGCDVSASRTRQRLAAVAGLAARVETQQREEGSGEEGLRKAAVRLGKPPKKGAGPPVSRLRFARLVATEELDELYTRLARVLPLVDNRVPLRDLADSVFWWNDERRRRWAYDYYRVAPERSETA